VIVHILKPQMRAKRVIGGCLTALFVSVSLAACGGSGTTTLASLNNSATTAGGSSGAGGTPVHGGSLTMDIPTSPQNFDIDSTNDNESIWALQDMAETLYSNAPDGKSVIPWLATGYTVSANKLDWTFHLRHGVRFSNGRPMTSKDVVWSITQAAAKQDAANSYVDTAIKSVTAEGPYTVRITTNQPWAPLLADLAMYANAIFPDHFLGESRSQFFQHPVGTGPFKLATWVKGQYLKLVRNPDYWQKGKPYLNSLTLQTVSDANTRIVQLRGGQAQIVEQAPFALLPSLQSAGLQVGLFPSSRIDYVTMNERFKPFANVHVRRAVADAIDRPAIMKAVFFGHGQVADSPFMPGLRYYSPVGTPAYNLAAAKAQLKQSPYPHGGFTVDFIAASGDPIQGPVSQIIASELAKLGIKVQIRQLDPSEVQAQEQSFHYGMRETYWTNDITDPDEYTSFTLCGSGPKCGGVFANFTHFNDPQINKLTLEGETTLNSTRRAAIYKRIQQLAAQQVPMVWLGYSPFSYAYGSAVHGFRVYTQGNTHFENVWLSK
jgi:peptide/nickel transport system substrate-binding protein